MKRSALIAFVFTAAVPLHALSQTVNLDFEGATSFASVANFYNGGVDGGGQTGTNFGIAFGGDALAFRTDDVTLSISNAPSGVTVMGAVGTDAFMNVVSGFAGALQFAYSSTDAGAVVAVFSGLNGSGTQLASFNLAANATSGCADAAYCHFDVANLAFAGVAKSVNFGTSPSVAYDNVSVSLVPEPSGIALAFAGFGVLGFAARRRHG